jgi:hypothetical protein
MPSEDNKLTLGDWFAGTVDSAGLSVVPGSAADLFCFVMRILASVGQLLIRAQKTEKPVSDCIQNTGEEK